jgi:P27 family predicted phage terminase small subunit
MTRGRRPTPSHLKLVKGNPGKRAVNKREPKPKREIPSPPACLGPVALVAWGKFAGIVDRMGVLTEADSAALERLCQTYAEVERYRELVLDDGPTYQSTTKDGNVLIKANPAVAMLADADRRFKSYLVEFGLTPAARGKVKVPDGEEQDDHAAKYF